MAAVRVLPARPSLDSLRKQAKKLARDAAAGNGEAIARAHAQQASASLPLSNRDAQLVIAREYGFASWPDLTAEVQKRLGHALEWAASQARVAIHDQDHERLRTLLAEYPALVSWRSEGGQTLLAGTTSYAIDSSAPERERIYNRPGNDPLFKGADLGWGPVTTRQVLDIALAWAVLNRQFEIASFLLERGANINTNWATHEPASILHEAAIQGREDAVRFLIDHGADLTMKDYRYHSNAEGWAPYGSHDERMADLLAAAAARRSRESL